MGNKWEELPDFSWFKDWAREERKREEEEARRREEEWKILRAQEAERREKEEARLAAWHAGRTCGACGAKGHNRTKCPTVPYVKPPKPPKPITTYGPRLHGCPAYELNDTADWVADRISQERDEMMRGRTPKSVAVDLLLDLDL